MTPQINNNYWSNCLYPLFLSTVSSCTLASLDEQELQDELDHLAIRAVAKFKFPKIDLSFEYDNTIEDMTVPVIERKAKGYYFINTPTIKEIEVIIAWMKVFWLEYQASKERNYENVYSDKDVKAFSSGNLLASIEKMYEEFRLAARKDEEDYSRVNKKGKPALGDVNSESV